MYQYLKNVHFSHMSLHGGFLSWLGYLGAGCCGNGASEELAPSKVLPNNDYGDTLVVSCSSTSPAPGTPPALDVLTSQAQRDSAIHSVIRLGNLASFLHNIIFLSLPRAWRLDAASNLEMVHMNKSYLALTAN